MKKIINTLLILLSIGVVSCIEIAKDIDLSGGDPELVVQSYLSPTDTSVILILTLSKPIYESNSGNYDYTFITNATVKISDDNQEYTLQYNSNLKYYFSSENQIKIVPGKKYKLNISTPDGKKVESSCTIPPLPNVTIQQIHLDSFENWEGMNNYTRKMKFTNNSGSYKYFVVYRRYYSLSEFKSDTNYYNQREEILEVKPNTSANFNLYDWQYDQFGQYSNPISDSLLIYQVDEPYYRYLTTIENEDYGDPFAEAVITYSNITNGLGVFCGYNKKYVKVVQ